ncbi:MAG: hypothetical protein ACYC9M_12335, partial [Desulfobulbaceae bacterium]
MAILGPSLPTMEKMMYPRPFLPGQGRPNFKKKVAFSGGIGLLYRTIYRVFCLLIFTGVTNMLKKRIVRSLYAFSFGAFALAGTVAQGNAWEQTDATKIVDYETHNNNPSLVQGTYTDWTGLPKPWNEGEGWPYSYNFYGR